MSAATLLGSLVFDSIFFIVPWIVFAVLAAVAAENRGNSMWSWFLLGLVLGPFAIAFAMVAPKGGPTSREYRCPHCQGVVSNLAVVCMHCTRDLPME